MLLLFNVAFLKIATAHVQFLKTKAKCIAEFANMCWFSLAAKNLDTEPHRYKEASLTAFNERTRPYQTYKVDESRYNRLNSIKTTVETEMTNIYVSPLASPSFECLSAAPERPPNELSMTTEEVKQDSRNQDENENELFESATKTIEKMKGMYILTTNNF